MRTWRTRIAVAASLLAVAAGTACAQPDSSRTAPPEAAGPRTAPTSSAADSAVYVMTRSPLTAVLMSAALPGAGQVYNKQVWKAPIFLGAATFFMVRALYYNGLYNDVAAQADQYPRTSNEYAYLKLRRESYRDNRDLNFAYCAGVYAISMIDAYVGAHMFDFDVDDDRTSRIYIDPINPGIGLAMRW